MGIDTNCYACFIARMAAPTSYSDALTQLNALVLSGDYLGAKQMLVVARGFAAGLPDYSVSDRSVTKKSAYLQLDQISTDLDSLKAQSSSRPALFSRVITTGRGRF